MKCKKALLILLLLLFVISFFNLPSFARTSFYEDDYYLRSRAFSNKEAYNMYTYIKEEYNKKGDFYNFLNPYLNNINSYHYYKIEDIPIVVTSHIKDEGGGYTYDIYIIPSTSPNLLFLNSDTTSYIRPNVSFSNYYYYWHFTIYDRDFSTISGGEKNSRFYTTNQPVYLGKFITDVSESGYNNMKIAYANYDFLSSDGNKIYFYGTFLSLKECSLPFMSSLKKYMTNGFESADAIEVVINDFPNLKGDGKTLNDFTFSVKNTSSNEEIYKVTFNRSSPFYSFVEGAEDMPFYKIPVEDFYEELILNQEYSFSITYEFEGEEIVDEQKLIYGYDYSKEDNSEDSSSIGSVTNSIINSNDELTNTVIESNKNLQNSIDEQTNTIKENTETNKNIFEKIGEILSYINPFSENFFAYKLLELLGELLKNLFIPSSEFMQEWISDLSSFLKDRLGFLTYPVSLIIDFLERFDKLDSTVEPIITTPELKLMNTVLLSSYTYNFNDLLKNETFKMLHDFYLLFVDVIMIIAFLFFANKVVGTIFGESVTDDIINNISSDSRYVNKTIRRKKALKQARSEGRFNK